MGFRTITTTVSDEDYALLKERGVGWSAAIKAHANQIREWDVRGGEKEVKNVWDVLKRTQNQLAKISGVLIDAVGLEKYKEVLKD